MISACRISRLTILFFSFLLIFAMAQPVLSHATEPNELVYLTEEYFPYNYEHDGQLHGISVDILREVWRRMGVEQQPICILPWARAYDIVQSEPNTMLFTMARNDSRESLFLWAGPISQGRFVLTALRNRHLQIASADDLKNYIVGTVIKDISDLLLEPYKSTVQVEPVTNMEYNLKKLLAGRIDLVSYEEKAMQRYLENHGFSPSDFETVFLLQEMNVYYAFHKDTDPDLIARFQAALDMIRSEPIYQEILKRHLQ